MIGTQDPVTGKMTFVKGEPDPEPVWNPWKIGSLKAAASGGISDADMLAMLYPGEAQADPGKAAKGAKAAPKGQMSIEDLLK